MRTSLILACIVGLLACASGAPLAPGLYSLKNVGFKTCDQESVYLGFNNKSCPIAPYARPASIGTNSVWKSWDITITGYHSSGYPLAYVSTGLPSGKTMKCPGNMSPLEPGTCGKSAVTINQAQSEWRLVGPVSGYTNPTYKLVANMKASGCARFLATSSSCEDSSLKMLTGGSSTRTLWELTPLQLGTKAPGPATIVTVARGTGSARTVATVSFTAPVDPGCGPITSYALTAKPLSGGGATVNKEVAGVATSAELSGLTANIRYNFTISATNACGTGPTTWYVETLSTSDAAVAAGFIELCAIKADTRMACFELNESDNYGEMVVPTKWRQGNDVVLMVSNYFNTAAVARNGTMGVWGAAIDKGCAQGIQNEEHCPAEGFSEGVVFAHGWDKALCVTKSNGRAACFGEEYINDDTDFEDLPGYVRHGNPNELGLYDGYIDGVKLMKAGDVLGCVVYLNGNLRCWGSTDFIDTNEADVPLPISFYSNIVDVGVNSGGICALKSSGDLECSYYEVPNDDGEYFTLPIPEGWKSGVAAVDCTYYGCCAWKSSGDFTCWGDTDSDGDCNAFTTYCLGSIPNWIAGINKYTWRTFSGSAGTSIRWPVMTDVVSFSMGFYGTCVIRKDGSLQCWGEYSQPNVVDWNSFQVQLTISGYDYLF